MVMKRNYVAEYRYHVAIANNKRLALHNAEGCLPQKLNMSLTEENPLASIAIAMNQ